MLLVEGRLRSYSTLLGFDPCPDKDLLADIGLALKENNPQKDLKTLAVIKLPPFSLLA